MQQREDAQRTVRSAQIEIRHATPEQRMPLAEVVTNAQTRHLAGNSLARLVHAKQLGHHASQCLRAFVRAAKRDRRHRDLQYTRTDWMTLGVIAVEQTLRRDSLDDLSQLPAQIHRILHASVETLPTVGRMHVCSISR